MGTVQCVGAESLLLLIPYHIGDFDRAKNFTYMLILVTEKGTKKKRSVLVLYTRLSFRFTSCLSLNVAPDSVKRQRKFFI